MGNRKTGKLACAGDSKKTIRAVAESIIRVIHTKASTARQSVALINIWVVVKLIRIFLK